MPTWRFSCDTVLAEAASGYLADFSETAKTAPSLTVFLKSRPKAQKERYQEFSLANKSTQVV